MDFINQMKGTIKLDGRYKSFQEELKAIANFENKDVFMISVVLGYKNGRKSDNFETGGMEFRPVYLSKDDRSVLYTFAFDIYKDEFVKNIEDKNFQDNLFDEFVKYSNGGMDILHEEVFQDNMVKGQFIRDYSDYDTDLMKYIYQSLTEAPF